MEKLINQITKEQEQTLFYYSPYNFISDIKPGIQLDLIKEKILNFINDNKQTHFTFRSTKNEVEFIFLYQYLDWDTDFFGRKCYKLYTILYNHFDIAALTEAINSFRNHLVNKEKVYIFSDIPSEDTRLIQCLGLAGFKLVESRLHYYKDASKPYAAERYLVRIANKGDLRNIIEAATNSRNEYDRIHADIDFSNELADKYLGTYAESAFNGFCDAVIVPAEDGVNVNSFLAIKHLKDDAAHLSITSIRVALTAVGASNKGWHKKLLSETIYYAKDHGAKYVLMTTQATNRAVIKNAENLGFNLGSTSHIFSFSHNL